MIGEMFRNDDGSVSGYIAEPTYGFEPVFFEPVASDNKRAPLFDLTTPTPIGRPFRLGSIWERVSKETGLVYFGGYIKSGASGYVPVRLFPSKKNPKAWVVVRKFPGELRNNAQEVELPQPPAPKRQRKAKASAPVEPEREAA